MKKSRQSTGIEIFPRSRRRKLVMAVLLVAVFCFGTYFWSLDPTNINLQAMVLNEPVALRIFAPTIVKKGETFTITVEAWDFCERLVCGYSSGVSFASTDPSAVLPSAYRFIPSSINQGIIEGQNFPWGDHGLKTFEVSLNSDGIHYINVTDERGLVGWSNPVVVMNNTPTTKIYWGDIHSHTIWCDGSGLLTEALSYAKDVACLDFASVSPHDHFVRDGFNSWLWPVTWELQKQTLNLWNRPNDFVTLLAYEYRGEYPGLANEVGDMCIYSRGSDIPFYSGLLRETTTPDLLFQKLREWQARVNAPNSILAIPHHPPHTLTGMTYDWSYFDPEFVRLVEIYSVHGSSEFSSTEGNRYPLLGGVNPPEVVDIQKPGYYVRDALAMGYHVGLMASGDSHDGHPGHSISHTPANHLLQSPISWKAFPHLFRVDHHYPNGLVAVFSPPGLTRENIFDSLWARQCYAVKGVSRPYLNFTINNHTVGYNDSVITVPTNTSARDVRIIAAVGGGDSSNLLQEVQIIRNNILWKNVTLNNRTIDFTFPDTDEITGMNYTHGQVRADGKYYITDTADIPTDPNVMSTNGTDVYYAKIFETGGGMAWIGPIWVASST